MLRIDGLTYRVGGRVLLDRASAAINPGHRVGMVGRNGTGKTTLLRLITGELDADEGAVSTPSRWRIGITAQEAPDGPQSLIDTVTGADPELADLNAEAEVASDPHRIAEIHLRLHDKDAHTANARAARILAGLGFDDQAQQRPCGEYSGGWRMRVALAALLFTEPDLLLLDEPTNHLDLEASLWLEDYLKRYSGTVLLVSHDRDLLNRVVGEILHLEHRKLSLYQGGYDRFERTRRMRLELDEKQRVKQQAERAHMQKYIDRFRYKANKAKQAQSRIKMLARMAPIAGHLEERGVAFGFANPAPLAPPVYAMEDVAVGYDGTAVLSDLSLRLDGDDRIALLGANGNGKSTLIKLLAGRLEPLAGAVTKSARLRVGYFAQHQGDEMDGQATPLIELGRKRTRDTEQQLRRHLGRFGFTQDRANTRVANLSGGEKARLLFALMSRDEPHILLLDEPTNHLDVDSRQALIAAINDFEGAVVLVSHDPHLIELIADRLWLVDQGRVRPFDGDMEDYRSLLLGSGKSAARVAAAEGRPNKKEKRRSAAHRRGLKKQLALAEGRVHRLEARRAELEISLADPALYEGGNDKSAAIHQEISRLGRELARAEEIWMAQLRDWDEG